MKDLAAFVGDRPFELFVDAEQFEKYDSELRSRWVSWLKDRPQKFRVYILIRSALVSVAVQIGKLIFGDVITSFTDRAEFEATLRQVLDRARGAASS